MQVEEGEVRGHRAHSEGLMFHTQSQLLEGFAVLATEEEEGLFL